MKCVTYSSSKSLNKLFLPKSNSNSNQSHTLSFHKLKILNPESDFRKSRNKFYYKNPQFLNDSNIKKQISILLTNVSNKNNNEHLPKIIFDESNKVNDINDIKNNYLKTEENEMLPKIKEQRRNRNRFNVSNISNDNSKSFYSINKSVDYTYKSIFPNDNLFKEKTKYIDNKLNLIYCQNESQYKYIMEKRKKIKGANIIEEESEKINKRLSSIKTKIKFMKNVIDYSYPSFLSVKAQIWKQNLSKIKGEEKLLPEEKQKIQIKNKNTLITNYLKKNFKVYPLKVE